MSSPKPGLHQLAKKSRSVLLVGCGGGADVVQTLPIMNYLMELGVKVVSFAGMGGKWFGEQGLRFGCEVLSLDWLAGAERLSEDVALVDANTQLTEGNGAGEYIHEAAVAAATGSLVGLVSLRGGVPGVRSGLRMLAEHVDADLIVVVDIGSDSFFSGEELTVFSPLIDALTLDAVNVLPIPSAVGLTGYGCDAEMPLAHLNRSVGKVMRAGGYLGAYGLTQQDVVSLIEVFDTLPTGDLERTPYKAAQGVLGTLRCKRFWSIEVLPLASVILFFDTQVLAKEVNPLPAAIAKTQTLAEAEEVIIQHGLFPETRLPQMITAPTPPQV